PAWTRTPPRRATAAVPRGASGPASVPAPRAPLPRPRSARRRREGQDPLARTTHLARTIRGGPRRPGEAAHHEPSRTRRPGPEVRHAVLRGRAAGPRSRGGHDIAAPGHQRTTASGTGDRSRERPTSAGK